MRVVFDTVVFVRSLLNPYSQAGKLVFAYADGYALVLSEPVVREILEVLQRPEISRKIRAVAEMDMGKLLDLFSQAELVEPTAIPSVCRDANDDKFLATAVAGGVDVIVSADKDMLDLEVYQGIVIVDMAAFLGMLEAGAHD